MILDRAVGRDVEEILRHEQRDESHHLQIRLERAKLLPHLGFLVRVGLIHREAGGKRGFHQRVGLLPRLLRRHIDGDNVLAALDERFEHCLAERLLAMNHDTHSMSLLTLFSLSSRTPYAGPIPHMPGADCWSRIRGELGPGSRAMRSAGMTSLFV